MVQKNNGIINIKKNLLDNPEVFLPAVLPV